MQKVTVYTGPACSYCVRAKRLLAAKNVPFEEIDVSRGAGLRREMIRRAKGMMKVPQIFVGETYVGGFEDLYALERKGMLDALLAAT